MSTKKSKAEKQANLAENTTNAPAAGVTVAAIPDDKGDTTPAAEAAPAEEKVPGKIKQIIEHHLAGKTNKEIADLGFHPTTIAIQVSKYKKLNPEKYAAEKAAKEAEKITKAEAAKAAKEQKAAEAKKAKDDAAEKAAKVAATATTEAKKEGE